MMAQTSIEFGIGTIREDLTWLRPVVKGWHIAIEETCAVLESDEKNEPPYASTEQAGVSFLAAGAWKAGMVAVAELSVVKLGSDGNPRNGRTDLLIADKNGQPAADLEAKFEFVQPGGDWAARKVNLELAVSEARRNQLRTNIGVCFYPLFVSESWANEVPGGIDAIIGNEIEKAIALNVDLLAWSFPAIMRKRKSQGGNRDFWPGLFVAMRMAV